MAMVHAVAPLLLAIDAMRSAEEFYGTQGASIDAGDAAARARAVVLGAAGLLDGEIRRRLGFAE